MALLTQKNISKKIQTYIQKKGSSKPKLVSPMNKSQTFFKTALARTKAPVAKLPSLNTALDQVKKNKKEQTRLGQRPIRQLNISWPADTLYRSIWIAKLINKLTTSGKKTQAEKIMLDCLTHVNQASRGNVLLIVHEAIELLRPSLAIVVRRIGRRYYQVPVPLKIRRQHTMALNWLLTVVKGNSKAIAAETLAEELLNTYFLKRSESLRQKEQLYQTVIKNRAFNHYRWV